MSNNFIWWYGVVINTANDPLQLGRAQVRILGAHGPNIEDTDLPWASVIVPTTEGGVSGIGQNPQLKPGARVIGFFLDGQLKQNPIIWGSVPGIEGKIGLSPYGKATGISGPSNLPLREVVGWQNMNMIVGGYPSDLSQGEIEQWIREEANLRGIDPNVAISVYRAEGAGSYQSTVARSGDGSLNGREASFGPYQLFIGGGLGEVYERSTGRNLITDNTREGIRNQIRFALDQAATGSWSPWYGYDAVYGRRRDSNNRPTDTAHYRQGLNGSRAVNNWS